MRRPYRSMRALYPGRQPGTFAAAHGGGSALAAVAAPSNATARGSMAGSSGWLRSIELHGCAAATRKRLPAPVPSRLDRRPIYSPQEVKNPFRAAGLSRSAQERSRPGGIHLEVEVEVHVG